MWRGSGAGVGTGPGWDGRGAGFRAAVGMGFGRAARRRRHRNADRPARTSCGSRASATLASGLDTPFSCSTEVHRIVPTAAGILAIVPSRPERTASLPIQWYGSPVRLCGCAAVRLCGCAVVWVSAARMHDLGTLGTMSSCRSSSQPSGRATFAGDPVGPAGRGRRWGTARRRVAHRPARAVRRGGHQRHPRADLPNRRGESAQTHATCLRISRQP